MHQNGSCIEEAYSAFRKRHKHNYYYSFILIALKYILTLFCKAVIFRVLVKFDFYLVGKIEILC